MKSTDPKCFETQLTALEKSGGLLGSMAKMMRESNADYAAVSGEGDDDVPMSVVVVCVGERAAAFKKHIDAFDDEAPAAKPRASRRR